MSPPDTPSDGPGLALHHVGVHFGGLVALDDVSLRVPPGRVVGVIGPNGAGKTTLFNVVCGFVRPGTGTLTLDGRPFRPRPHRLTRLGIARTLQGVGLFPGLTVLENVVAGASHDARPASPPRCSACPAATVTSGGCAPGPSTCSPSWVSTATPGPRRPPCPTRCASGSRWPAR
ncbi:ATP-binding cassette domain-containing protein [Micromonospora sp. WMMA1996]|uniref:ATP-binding cassette domain-containing protein n=1 Tax=Micromonospora sp. WMMA1996 TaxID=2039878 RepID=UPI00350E3599